MRRKYRSAAGIIYDVLRVLDEKGPLPPTRLATFTNLPYDRLRIFLESLKEKGYIEEDEEGIEVTESGREALKKLEEAKKLMEFLGFKLRDDSLDLLLYFLHALRVFQGA